MKILYFSLFLLSVSCQSVSQQTNDVIIIGEMKNVMKKGQLYGTINLDTISNKKNLYGLGPIEYLRGEVMIIDGKCYKASIDEDQKMQVEETYIIKSPFFGYSNVTNWKKKILPKNVQTISELEEYIIKHYSQLAQPFFFKIKGKIEKATIHVVNLPEGSKVSSPQEAHQGQVNFNLQNEQVEIVGFFSKQHKTIFTHHDTYLHMHLITEDKNKMGHLDKIVLKSETVKIYFLKEIDRK